MMKVEIIFFFFFQNLDMVGETGEPVAFFVILDLRSYS